MAEKNIGGSELKEDKGKEKVIETVPAREFDLRHHRPLLGLFRQKKTGTCLMASLLDAFSLRIAAVTKQPPVRLSLQQLIDYGPKEYAQAIRSDDKRVCQEGGIYTLRVQEICDFISTWGVCRAEDYRFIWKRNPNPPNFFDKPRYKFTGYKLLKRRRDGHYSMKELEMLLKTSGVIALLITYPSFQTFKGKGIYQGPEPTDSHTDGRHAVTVVGCGPCDGDEVDPGVKYILFKNTWRSSWGDEGFGRIACTRVNVRHIVHLEGFKEVPASNRLFSNRGLFDDSPSKVAAVDAVDADDTLTEE